MFEQKVREINSRLAAYKDLGRQKIDGGFFRKIKNLYSSILFFVLKPLLNYQNAYNRAVYDFTVQSTQHLEQVQKHLSAISGDIETIEKRLKKLEYKVMAGFPEGFDYAQFEDQFRGPEKLVQERQKIYLDYLNKGLEVLDIGCGRGEFLQLLAREGFKARGIDSSPQMVARCKDKGLDVVCADAVSYIKGYGGSLGNVFLSQIVEHMDYKDIYSLVKAAWEKMEREAVILIETINPGSFFAQSRSYVIDPTHVGLVSPETLSYTFQKVGFRNLRIIYKSPVPKSERLSLAYGKFGDSSLDRAISKINNDLKKIDGIIFGNLEYAIMGVK